MQQVWLDDVGIGDLVEVVPLSASAPLRNFAQLGVKEEEGGEEVEEMEERVQVGALSMHVASQELCD